MGEMQMGAVEARFADIVWQREPISTSELVKLCEGEFNWKKTTTYTVLKRLCEKGIFQNNKGVVTSLLSRDDFYAKQSEKFVDETFGGSLPAFFAAFTHKKALTCSEIEEISRLIDKYKEGANE